VLHSDIKAENALYGGSDGRTLKLADFGLAVYITPNDGPLTRARGSRSYMAPEMLAGEGYGFPADMWSLGVLVYVILVGQFPIGQSKQTKSELTRQIIKANFKKPLCLAITVAVVCFVPVLKVRAPTPLQLFAKSLQESAQEADATEEDAPMLFPMYTVPSEALLQMTAVEPHEVLKASWLIGLREWKMKAKGVLVKFEDSKGKAAFISHQWVGGDHPDPEFRQFSILQAALRKLLTTMRSVPLDYVSEGVVAFAKSLKTDVFKRPRPQLLGGVLFMSALDIAIFSGQTEAVRLLVARGAKLSGLIDAVIYSAISGKAECIRILQELRPDYNVNPRMFYGADTLQAACAYATMDVVDELLKQERVANDKAVLSKGLCLAATNWGCSPQLVLKLVEYGADVNFQLRASHFALSYQVVSKYFALRYRLGVRSPISVMMYHLDGLTPLMACLFTGQYDGAAALLASGARPELRNSRGWNAEDVIKGQTIPGWLKNGMAGQLSDCEDVVETEPVRLMNLAGKLKRSIAAEQGRLEMRRRLQGQSSNTGSSSDFHKIAPSSEEPLTNPLTGSQSAQAAQDETLARHLAVQVKRLKVVEFMRTLLRRNPEVRCSASEALQAEIFIQQQSQEVLDDDEGDLLVVNRRPLKRQKDGEKEGDKEADKEGDKGAADLQQNASEGSPVNQQRKSDKTSRDLSYQPDSPRHSKPEPGSPPASQSARKEK
ncbi:Dclk1, partial [Symbiodinium necroappetens]